MPTSALISATIETAINAVLKLDPDSQGRLAPLHGARLIAYIDPLPHAIMLAFSQQVDVLTVSLPFEEMVGQLNSKDCCIKTSLQTLPELKNTNMLTRLIQQNKLQVEGELAVAQQASALFQQLDIDAEEIVAGKTNDVLAHQSFRILGRVKAQVQKALAGTSSIAANAIVEEKKLAAHKLAVMHFSDEVNSVRDAAAKLDARLTVLEQQKK